MHQVSSLSHLERVIRKVEINFVILLVFYREISNLGLLFTYYLGLRTSQDSLYGLRLQLRFWQLERLQKKLCQFEKRSKMFSKSILQLLCFQILRTYFGHCHHSVTRPTNLFTEMLMRFDSIMRQPSICFGWIRGTSNPADVDAQINNLLVETSALTAATGIFHFDLQSMVIVTRHRCL